MFDTLLERLEKWCKEHPEKNLYTFLDDKGTETTKLSYLDVDNMTSAIATTMRQPKSAGGWGIEAKDRVLLVYPPSLDFIVAYLACLRAGVVAVPVFPQPWQAAERPSAFCKYSSKFRSKGCPDK